MSIVALAFGALLSVGMLLSVVAVARGLRIRSLAHRPRPLPRGCASGNHWPRDEVRICDGTTVAHICRRCDYTWVNEEWVRNG